jgi:hypothetical protein
MKSRKVIDTHKTIMSQEFQHCLESQLIEVMILKMHPIQFAVIVNLMQMKWKKMRNTLKNMMNQNFQYHEELGYVMTSKSYKSICDQQHQREKHFQKQICIWQWALSLFSQQNISIAGIEQVCTILRCNKLEKESFDQWNSEAKTLLPDRHGTPTSCSYFPPCRKKIGFYPTKTLHFTSCAPVIPDCMDFSRPLADSCATCPKSISWSFSSFCSPLVRLSAPTHYNQ